MKTRKKTVKPVIETSEVNVIPGQAPGTITLDQHAVRPTIRAAVFDPSGIEWFRDIGVDAIPTPISGQTLWVDVTGFADREIVDALAERFGIHELSLEDAVKPIQRPKIDFYDEQVFVVVRMPDYEEGLTMEQISLFFGKNYVLSWQSKMGDCFDPIRERLNVPTRAVRNNGADFLTYALADAIVDSFFPVIHQMGDRLEMIEDTISESDSLDATVRELFTIRSEIRDLRRSAWSQREMIRTWMAYQGPLIAEETRLHLSDVADHTIRVVELLEGCRETCSDLRDLQMSAASMRMNEVMKVLTVIATIFIPLGFIAGLYGMNFSSSVSPLNMPETQWYFGYPFALALMVAVAAGMLFYFRRKGWI